MAFGFGGIRDTPDSRDHPYVPPAATLANLPSKIDLRKSLPPVYNQHEINSCTANAIAAAMAKCIDDTHAAAQDVPPGQHAAEAASVRASAAKALTEMMPAMPTALEQQTPGQQASTPRRTVAAGPPVKLPAKYL